MKKVLFIIISVLIAAGCTERSREKSIENIHEIIETDILAAGQYAAFSHQAGNEDIPRLAAMFSAASDVASIQTKNYFKILDEYGDKFDPLVLYPSYEDTEVNLKKAMISADFMVGMYRNIVRGLPRADSTSAKKVFTEAMANSKDQLTLFKKAEHNFGNDHLLPQSYFVCNGCGKLFIETAPENCSRCGKPSSGFLFSSAEKPVDNELNAPE